MHALKIINICPRAVASAVAAGLPGCLCTLMSADRRVSPLAKYYPEQFEVDINGKLHGWEAVVLLPFLKVCHFVGKSQSCMVISGRLIVHALRNDCAHVQ